MPQLSLSVPPGWHLFIQKGHESAFRSKRITEGKIAQFAGEVVLGRGAGLRGAAPLQIWAVVMG